MVLNRWTSKAAVLATSMALISACAPGSTPDAVNGSDTSLSSGDVPTIGEVTTALFDEEYFSFSVEIEGAPFGPDGTTEAQSAGRIDLANDAADYEPLINPTGSAEVRIIGHDFYGSAGGGSWELSRRPSEEPPWIDFLMPLSGDPLLVLRRLADLDLLGSAIEVADQAGRECRDYLDPDVTRDGEERTFTACQEDGILRWVGYPESDEGGPITLAFDDVGEPFEVVRPTENVTDVTDSLQLDDSDA